MTSMYLLERFEHIANLSALMLAAAREDNWQEVARLKESAAIIIDEVRVLSATVALSVEEREVKLASMQRILVNDGQIQELSQPWLRRVARWLYAGRPATGRFERTLR
jgi:flagellar protein FliT